MGVRMLDRLGLAQRVVLIIAWAMALVVLGLYLVSLERPAANFGWFGYAPVTQASFQTGLRPWEQLLIWIGLILAWTIGSVLLLHRRATRPVEPPSD